MTRAELRHKVLFERWLQSDGDLTFGEWLDSLRERARVLRNQTELVNRMTKGQNNLYEQQQMMAAQMQGNPFNMHQMGGDNPLAGLGGLLGSSFAQLLNSKWRT